jgi:hypothetical protein
MTFMLSQTTQIYVIELWSPDGNERLGRVASSTSLFIANAAFHAAVAHYAHRTIVLSTSGRIIRRSSARSRTPGDSGVHVDPRIHGAEKLDGVTIPAR